jgi:hypothetical protein
MSELEITLSRVAVVPASLLWPETTNAVAYELDERRPLEEPEPLVSVFQADAVAVRAVKRLHDGRKLAALAVIRSPLSHESDERLIALATPNLQRAIENHDG